GQPVSMLIPRVVGFKLTGEIPSGVTATDVVLTITDMLRQHGAVGKFVEFYGKGVAEVPLANRATIGNMSPEFGSTAAIFPIDEVTIDYLKLTGRSDEQIQLVEDYAKTQGLWHDPDNEVEYSEYLELDLSTVVPSISGPKRPQDRIELSDAKNQFAKDIHNYAAPGEESKSVDVSTADGRNFELANGAVAIASITSCTNTSNPSVMMAAGLLARNARKRGLNSKPWVKTSIAPGSKVVTEYYNKAGLIEDLEALNFYIVGYGCTTCIGNSGPLDAEISDSIQDNDLSVTAVLSGNRNFEGRISPDVKMNYLASPPLVIAYALAGTMDFDFENQPLGKDAQGVDVYLADLWPTPDEVESVIADSISTDMFDNEYGRIFDGDERWQQLDTPEGKVFEWDDESTYVRKPTFFDGMGLKPEAVKDIKGARVLAKLGDSVTTDHISPAGSFKADTPAGKYLVEHGVERKDFNSYGSRRGNHEVMIRGTFANIRLQNQLLDGVQGGFTRDFSQEGGPQTTIYDASVNYQAAGTPLVVLGGKEYGSGSSRDWAAKGTKLLGVEAVITESFERIHRSNLIGMGVLPLQFPAGESADSLGLDGTETFSIEGVTELNEGTTPATVKVTAEKEDGTKVEFDAVVRIDTPGEADYYRNGGILQYVLRQLAEA
ncbi:MAG: aconitate hydratase AcnA, partial [Brevibacterium linens]